MSKEVVTDLRREKRRRGKAEHPQSISKANADHIARMLVAGRSVMSNCGLGFMVEPRERDGKLWVVCPVDGYPIAGPAEAEYVRQAIAGWARRLKAYEDALSTDQHPGDDKPGDQDKGKL